MFYDETAAFTCQSHPSERPDLLHLNNHPSHPCFVHEIFIKRSAEWCPAVTWGIEGSPYKPSLKVNAEFTTGWSTLSILAFGQHAPVGCSLNGDEWCWNDLLGETLPFFKLCQGAIMLVCDAYSLHCCTQVSSILLTWNVAECNTY